MRDLSKLAAEWPENGRRKAGEEPEKGRRRPGAVGLKAFPIRQPLDISQNRKFFNATYFSKNAKIV